jgi:hypothetical protein
VYAPDRSTPPPPPPPAGRDGSRNARYAYLVGRLRNRQITMEEATELFTLMQAMLQTSEAARIALMRTPTSPAPAVPAPPRPSTTAVVPTVAGNLDDLLLVGLLAMGAGAGLLAANTKRVQGAPSASGTESPSTTGPASASRKG